MWIRAGDSAHFWGQRRTTRWNTKGEFKSGKFHFLGMAADSGAGGIWTDRWEGTFSEMARSTSMIAGRLAGMSILGYQVNWVFTSGIFFGFAAAFKYSILFPDSLKATVTIAFVLAREAQSSRSSSSPLATKPR